MFNEKILLAFFATACLQAGPASAAVDPEDLKGCLAPVSAAQAIPHCDRMLASDGLSISQTIQAATMRALAYAETGAPEKALANIDALVARFPEHARVEGARTLILTRLQRWPQAEASAKRAIYLDDALPYPYMLLADALEQRGETAAALQNYEKAALRGQDFPDIQNNYCWALAVANRDLDKALAACNRAITLKRSASALDSRALVHFRKGSYVAAISDYDAALSERPSASSLYVRGLAKKAMRQEAAGQADLEAAARLEPGVAARFAAWGVAPVAPLTVAPLTSAPSTTGAVDPDALRRAELAYQAQERRLASAESLYERAERGGRATDEALDLLEDDVWEEEDQLDAAARQLIAAGGHPDLVPKPGVAVVSPPPGSPAAQRIAAARANYLVVARALSGASAEFNLARAAGQTPAAELRQLEATARDRHAAVQAARVAYDAAVAAAR